MRHGLLMARVELLAKPFSPLKLAAKVREVLDKARVVQSASTQESYAEVRSLLTRFQALGDQSNQAALLDRLGWMAREQGDAAKSSAWLEEGLALSRRLGDRQHIAWLLITSSGVAILREDAAGAEALIEQGRALNPDSHDWIGWSLNHLGHAAQLRREYSRAEQLHQQALAVFIEWLGDKNTGGMWAYHGLGETALGQADAMTAQQWLRAGLRLSRDLGARIMIAWCLAGLGSAAVLEEELERAARLWGAAEHLRVTLGYRSAPAARATYERLLAQVRAQLGEDLFTAAWAAGEALELEQAIVEALGDEQ